MPETGQNVPLSIWDSRTSKDFWQPLRLSTLGYKGPINWSSIGPHNLSDSLRDVQLSPVLWTLIILALSPPNISREMDSRLQSSGSSKSSESPLLHPLLSAHITLEVLYPFGGGGGADLGRGNCRIRNFYYLHISTRLSHFLQVFFHLCRKGESQQPRPGDRGGGGGRGVTRQICWKTWQ